MWVDLNARARGLRGRLLGPTRLRALSVEPDIAAIARRLVDPSRAMVAPTSSARQLDLAIRREAAASLALLVRRMGERASKLRVIVEDEDRRSLRRLVRGAVAGVPAEARIAGLMPTPGLPESALRLLASASSPAQIGAALVAMGNPYGPVILGDVDPTNTGLAATEIAIDRLWAERSRLAVRRAGRTLRRFVRDTIDVENALSALALAADREAGAQGSVAEIFVAGGRRVARELFDGIAAGDPRTGAGRLMRLWRRPGGRTRPPRSMERWLLDVRIHAMTREAIVSPTGPAPLLEWFLRLRAQTMDLGAIVWSRALGAPPPWLESPAGE